MIKQNTFTTLDGVRGVAALLVVMHHISFLNPWGLHCYLAVDLFFVLSGVVLSHAYDIRIRQGLAALQFLSLRMVRLYPLYILGSLNTAVQLLIDRRFSAVDFGLALAMLPNFWSDDPRLYPFNAPGWSLFAEIVANAVYFAVAARPGKTSLLLIAGVSWLALAHLSLEIPGHLDLGFVIHTASGGLARVAYSFFIGVLAHRVAICGARPLLSPSTAWASAGAWFLVLAAMIAIAFPVGLQDRGIYDLIVVTVLFPALTIAAARVQPGALSAKVFSVFGALSYPMYMLHLSAAALYGQLYTAISHRGPDPSFFCAAPFMGSLLLTCWIAHKLYDAPLRQWLLGKGPFSLGRVASV